jgi:hypothetical protein
MSLSKYVLYREFNFYILVQTAAHCVRVPSQSSVLLGSLNWPKQSSNAPIRSSILFNQVNPLPLFAGTSPATSKHREREYIVSPFDH